MRQVLVEAARRRNAQKRGGGELLVTLDDQLDGSPATSDEVLALEAALEELGKLNPRQAQVIEYRFFGGLENAETAEVLGVSEATVARDWRASKAWLALQLRHAGT
jgi:RNA polymerase sigma factor (TIGR02999 family)